MSRLLKLQKCSRFTNVHAFTTKHASLHQFNGHFWSSDRHLEFCRHFESFWVGPYLDLLSLKDGLGLPIFMLLP